VAECFVVMGFGKKTDFETGRVLDLDKTYRNIIRPAVQDAGLTCIRADDIVHSGLIDVPMYERLLGADVVVADLSTSNPNAFYELGVRHALRPHTTLVIMENGAKSAPFDVNHITIRKYQHLGPGIDHDEVMRFREELTNALRTILANVPVSYDSPVYRFVDDLDPPRRRPPGGPGAGPGPVQAPPPAGSSQGTPVDPSLQTHAAVMAAADEAEAKGQWDISRNLLSFARGARRDAAEDAYLMQRLARATYKGKAPNEKDALLAAADLLRVLEPSTSNDTETLGLWGAVHKRLWQVTGERPHLDEAIRANERGFYLRNDYYNGINYAYLLNERGAVQKDRFEAIADFVVARRVRGDVLRICQQWLATVPDLRSDEARAQYADERYWVLATAAEAAIGLGDPSADDQLAAALREAPQGWMADSTQTQVNALRNLLAKGPLLDTATTGSNAAARI
jgi:hypothetical protein